MTFTSETLENFGQDATPAHQLGTMAREIAEGIDGGKRPARVGFVWYRPQGLFQQNLIRETRPRVRVA